MKRAEFIKKVSEVFEVSQVKAKEMIESFEDVIIEGVKEDGCVPFLGKFTLVEKAERNARNPQTGETIVVPATRVIKHKADKATKEAVK